PATTAPGLPATTTAAGAAAVPDVGAAGATGAPAATEATPFGLSGDEAVGDGSGGGGGVASRCIIFGSWKGARAGRRQPAATRTIFCFFAFAAELSTGFLAIRESLLPRPSRSRTNR